MKLAVTAAATLVCAAAVALPFSPAAGAAPVPACGDHVIAISATRGQGADEHGSLLLRFHNVSRSSCSLTGYPGLDALNAVRHRITSADRTTVGFSGGARHGVRTVVVHPGSYASADVDWLEFDPRTGGNCLFSHYIDVTAANTSRVVRLSRVVSVCGLQVHPTVAGITGNG